MSKKNNKHSVARKIRISLLLGVISFLVISLTLTTVNLLFYTLKYFGVINEHNVRTIFWFDYAAVCIILGWILSTLIVHRPISTIQRLLNAMEQIADGDFSVRLKKRKGIKIEKKIIAMFNHMADQLSSSEMLSHDFISNFSHEFKTPIASISGFAKLLRDGNISDSDKDDYLNIIIQESERLSYLSNNILSLSKLERQSILTNKTEYNITEQLRITIGSLYPRWSVKKLSVEFEADDLQITANKDMLGQVWINLLDNAIKFSPENGSVIIKLTKDENEYKVTFSNEYKSQAVENTERLFDKFYQGDFSHSTSGNGLGLSIAKRIIELHSGSISADTSTKDMIEFMISLPNE